MHSLHSACFQQDRRFLLEEISLWKLILTKKEVEILQKVCYVWEC